MAEPTFTGAAGFDVSRPLRDVVRERAAARRAAPPIGDPRPDAGPVLRDRGHSPDGAVRAAKPAPVIPGTRTNFEGLSNEDNFDVLGIRVNPPDPVGDVGPTTTSK